MTPACPHPPEAAAVALRRSRLTVDELVALNDGVVSELESTQTRINTID